MTSPDPWPGDSAAGYNIDDRATGFFPRLGSDVLAALEEDLRRWRRLDEQRAQEGKRDVRDGRQ